jgi:hypothetical protein
MNSFLELTNNYPYLSSAIKFLILGTLGEYLANIIKSKFNLKCFTLYDFISKFIIWAILGVLIKWIFSSFSLLVDTQIENKLLPIFFRNKFLFAIAVSLQINLFFTPFLIYFHRTLDNLFERKINFKGLNSALYSIFWFWIPAHILTFILNENLRILFAGFLSIVFGLILGISKKQVNK